MLTWADIDRPLREGKVDGVPPGTDLEQFIWDAYPQARPAIEGRNPGRSLLPRTNAVKNRPEVIATLYRAVTEHVGLPREISVAVSSILTGASHETAPGSLTGGEPAATTMSAPS
jgi:hypothetical protein